MAPPTARRLLRDAATCGWPSRRSSRISLSIVIRSVLVSVTAATLVGGVGRVGVLGRTTTTASASARPAIAVTAATL